MTDVWFIHEEVENSHPLFSVDAISEYVDAYKHGIPKGLNKQAVIKGEKDTDLFCFVRKDFDLASKAFFEKILSDVDWAFGISQKVIEHSAKLMKLSNKINDTDCTKLSNQELAELIDSWATLRRETHSYGVPWNYVELEYGHFSKYFTEVLEKKIKEKNLNLSAQSVFATLSTPTEITFAKKEEIDLINLAILKNREGNSPSFEKKFEEHFKKYRWLPYVYLGPAMTRRQMKENLELVAKRGEKQLLADLEKKKVEEKKLVESQNELIRQLGLSELEKKLVKLAQSFIFTKATRKDAIYHGFYCCGGLFAECAKRMNLTREQFRMIMSWELKQAVESGKFDSKELDARYAYRVFHYDGKTKRILSGEKARKFFESLEFEEEKKVDSNVLKGNCACPGYAKGAAKIINTPAEMSKMRDGDVLVSRATTPDIMVAIKKASAIVTDMGGITCHAAIVSRELKIPCVIGTKNATKVLHDGDLVEVDAAKGIVRKLK